MIELLARKKAADAAVDRFKGRPLVYGTDDCIVMAAFLAEQRGHHPQLGFAGSYRTLSGAKKALKRAGYQTLAAALDAHFPRIAPAAVLPADIIMVPSDVFDGGLGAVVGNGRVLGWHEDCVGAEIVHPVELVAAWRT